MKPPATTRKCSTLVLVLLAAASCAGPQYFRPVGVALTESVDGFSAGQYELLHEKEREGEVRVWSTGARRDKDAERKARTVLGVAFEIENTSNEELQLVVAETRLRAVQTRDGEIDSLESLGSRSPIRVAPKDVITVDLYFDLPPDTRPKHVDSFRLHWVIAGPSNRRYELTTRFRPARRARHSGFYWGHPMGWGIHWGFAPRLHFFPHHWH